MLAEPITVITISVNQTIMLYSLNVHSDVGQLFLNETEEKKKD